MKCPKCHSDNPDDSRFCGHCASPLQVLEEASFSFTKTIQTPSEVLTKGSIFAERYRILEELGEGGMGVVYKAEDTRLKRIVALKFLSPALTRDQEARERFVHEAQAASGLDHPNICTVYEIDETDARQIYIAMAYYEGMSLKVRIKQGPLELEEAIDIAVQVAQGLDRAHRQGIIHRDIKPANIMVTGDCLAKIVDFGLAKLAGTTRITKAGTTMGTAAYMSPEQARGEAVDHRSDIWSLGVVIYEMITGQLPFKGDHEQAIVYSILNKEPKPAKGLPLELEKILLKALTKNPAERFKDTDELLEALQQIGESLGMKITRRAPFIEKPHKRKWLSSPALWTSVFILLCIAAGLFFLLPSKTIPFSERDWILITDFENLTGDEVFDRSLTTALMVNIQQSRYVNVFPRARVKETLQRMGKEATDKLDEVLGSEVAVREGIRALVSCSINQVGDVYTLTGSIIDPNTQVTLKTEASQAKGKDGVLDALDDLAGKIRKDLGESLKDIQEERVGLPKATTSSLEALKNYVEADRARGSNRGDEAVALLEKALELDPDFALAHAELGSIYYWGNDRDKGEEHFTKALSLLERLTEREKLWIQAIVPAYRGNRDEAVTKFRVYLMKYPDDSTGWHNLGHNYLMLRRYDEAIDAFTRVIKVNPQSWSAYINIASCYSGKGMHQKAIENYLEAYRINPKFLMVRNLNREFGFEYVALGEVQKAQEVLEKMLTGEDWQKAVGHRHLALLDMYQGKLSSASDHLKESILLNNTLNYTLSEIRDRLYLATVYKIRGMMDAFHGELDAVAGLRSKIYIGPWWLMLPGKMCARFGKLQEARRLLEEISAKMNKDNREDRAAFNILKGEIELAGGNYNEAKELFEVAYKLRDDNYVFESLAYAYFRKGDLDKSIEKYEYLITSKEFGWEAQEYWIQSHYRLGKIYDKKDDVEKAIQYYQRFLDIWKEADPDIPELIEARERLKALQK